MGDYMTLYLVGGLLLVIGVVATWRNTAVSTGHAVLLALGAALVALPHLKDFEFGDGKLKFTTRDEARKIAEAVQTLSEQQVVLSNQLKDTTTRVTDSISTLDSQQSKLEAAVKKVDPSMTLPQYQNYDPTFWNDLKERNNQIGERFEQKSLEFNRLQQEFAPKM